MSKIQIKYSTAGKAQPPRPIKLQVPGWGGSPDIKMENGSEPQPWHCPPFVEGATYGLELVYHYEVECHVINENGIVRFDWDYAREPGGVLGPDEFGVFAPTPNKFYFIASLVDLQVPPGYVVRTQPHPRFYTDDTGTVPAAVVGHVQTEWWPKKLFVVMKAPRPGERHIYRKGDPYVQLLFVPKKDEYELAPMTEEENQHRRKEEINISFAKSFIAKSVWQNPAGAEFNDHYRQLSRAFAKGGEEAVEQTIADAVRTTNSVAPLGKTAAQYLELSYQHQKEGRLLEAREALFRAREIDPMNPEAASRLGIVAGAMGLDELAVKMMTQAVSMRPDNAAYHNNLGVALRKIGRLAEAETAFREALRLAPNDAMVMSNLGLTVAEQGRGTEGLSFCESACLLKADSAAIQYRAGLLFALVGQKDGAKAKFEAAIRIEPNHRGAKDALKKLSS